MRLVQFLDEGGKQRVGPVSGDGLALQLVAGFDSVYALALVADRAHSDLASLVQKNLSGETAVSQAIIQEKRLLPPLTHPDPAHCFVTGTGLTHLGSAKARDEMHLKTQTEVDAPISDSMRIFQRNLNP